MKPRYDWWRHGWGSFGETRSVTEFGAGHPLIKQGGVPGGARALRRAFTLVDVLVSVAVIGILIGLLMPGLARVNSQSRRVVCSSNLRQIGLGLAMYASDYRGLLPPSI